MYFFSFHVSEISSTFLQGQIDGATSKDNMAVPVHIIGDQSDGDLNKKNTHSPASILVKLRTS